MAAGIREYSKSITGLDQFGPIICALVEEILIQNGIQYQRVNYRIKTQESASKKISASRGKYSTFDDLTDLLGIRVITYFPKDVDRAAIVLEKEFKIDKKNSVDKRKLLDPDRFGYLSLHRIATLTDKRMKLMEYRRFKNTWFELQLRSVLQHAWAEIEHDLGYKTESGLPDPIKRDFSRLAGLLELADEEFERIRGELGDYEKRVESTLKTAPQKLELNQATVVSVLTNEQLLSLDNLVAKAVGLPLAEDIEKEYVSRVASELKALGVSDLKELLDLSSEYRDHIKSFASYWIKPDSAFVKRGQPLPRGIGLFYLEYVLVAQKTNEEVSRWGKIFIERPKVIKEVRATWDKVLEGLQE